MQQAKEKEKNSENKSKTQKEKHASSSNTSDENLPHVLFRLHTDPPPPAEQTPFKLDPVIMTELGIKAREEYPNLKQNVIDDIINNIELTLNPIYSQYLTVCKTNNGEGEIDVAILQALLKAKSKNVVNENSIQSQLRLALKWNRIDIAKNFILTDENKEKMGSLDNLMFTAIKDDRFEFVDLFLENGFSLKSFLSFRVLLKLYNEVIFKMN
jgi:transient receptor potential cation channel subfamily M protein 2